LFSPFFYFSCLHVIVTHLFARVERAIASSGMTVAPPPRLRQPTVTTAPPLALPPPSRERRSAEANEQAAPAIQRAAAAATNVDPVDNITNVEDDDENNDDAYEDSPSWGGFGDTTIVPDDTPVRLASGIRGTADVV
jgi:hypothetical protein